MGNQINKELLKDIFNVAFAVAFFAFVIWMVLGSK